MSNGEKNYFDPRVLARLSNLYLKARWVVEGIMSGIHRSRSKGFSVEFEEHREYSPGDEIRRIDWKALGKFDRYFIKETEDETNLRAYLLLDSSASMDYASNGITKFDYGCILTASLAYLILQQQDAAGLVTFSNRVDSFIPPRAKRGYLMEILHALEERRPSGEYSEVRVIAFDPCHSTSTTLTARSVNTPRTSAPLVSYTHPWYGHVNRRPLPHPCAGSAPRCRQ